MFKSAIVLTLIAAKPHMIFEWGTQYASSPDSLNRSRVIFSPAFEYATQDQMRGVVRSTPTVTVHAVGAGDEEIFQVFNRVLRKTEDECRPPIFKKWENAIREREFVTAEKALICTASFHAQFFDVATRVDTLTARFVHYRGSLWSLASDIPVDQCQVFLDEFFRLEALGLPRRLDADEFFAGNAARVPSSGVNLVRQVIPEAVRHEVWRRDQGSCVRCGSQQRLEFDHIIPLSKGGSSTARNIQLLCEPCNRSKGATVAHRV
jgi:HNH endonuclease